MPAPLIAIVEDNPAIASLVTDILTDEGYRTMMSASARDARAMIPRERPALVILDVQLEYAQAGWELVHKLRNEPTVMQTPLLICSADATFLNEKAEDIASYDIEVLKKPFRINELIAIVTRLIGPGSLE